MNVTTLGQLLRETRFGRNERMLDMALALECSTAYLSAIELGKRPVTDEFKERLLSWAGADMELRKQLEWAVKMNTTTIAVKPKRGNEEEIDLALAFAKKLGSLSDQDKQQLKEILEP